MNVSQNNEFIQKLKNHLRTLFQFDSAELDFGIYRIMNYKRQELENFIENDLITAVGEEFEKYKTTTHEELKEGFEEAKKELVSNLGEAALTPSGEVKEQFQYTPIAQHYKQFKTQLDEINITENIQSLVFNDLYNFFSRYYEDGDFVSKRRYSSKQHKYAIPYSGEEVKLYWANFDQYYVKTGEIFKDYEFNQKGWRFIFRTVLAEVETGNVKGERRYFFLSSNSPVKIENKACFIEFEYRPLTDKDLKQYPVKTKGGKAKTTGITQDELNPILKDKILDSITPLEPKAILGLPETPSSTLEIASPSTRNDNKETLPLRTCLEKHLYKYTRKITSDFFIHKNLKDFLERELDYFIKTEVLDIESLDTEKYFDRHLTRAKVVKNIGKRIIEFLSQIEEFQKLLWEKKKFVLRTDYVITIDRVPEALHQEILKNKEQLKEWEELGFGKIEKKGDLIANRDFITGDECKKLPVDTKYFSEEFTERLLERLGELGNLDDLIDGVLIKSENWQALNLILGKYKEKVQCIYIDPPYNTGSDEFLYKDKYQDSSWLTMIENRLRLAKELICKGGSFFSSIDDNEVFVFKNLLDMIFGDGNFISNLIWRKRAGGGGDSKFVSTEHEYILCYSKDSEKCIFNRFSPKKKNYPFEDKRGRFTKKPLHNPRLSDSSGLHYDIKCPDGRVLRGDEHQWVYSEKTFKKLLDEDKIIFEEKNGNWKIYYKTYMDETQGSVPYSILYSIALNSDGVKELKELRLDGKYDYPKPSELIAHLLRIASSKECVILDFFAGSGTTAHAVINLNHKDAGKRKYILVEMADYFDTIIIPRLKKVCYSFNWKDGKPQDTDGISQIIKYHYLEQYEDTLHNVEFSQEERGQRMLTLFPEEAKAEYLMKYMLRFETEGSPSLLNLKQFENPFEYKLKIISNGKSEEVVNVDLVETFNYLIGLRINGYRFLNENGRKYVIVLGERNNRRTAVVWRPIKACPRANIDLEKDRETIEKVLKSFNPDEIFINGDSFVEGYKPIESEFKALLGV